MGVNPVGNVQKYFTFDGKSSKDYNTHITGSGVFNAPVRDVEMITIPNRNGEFALDRGHFNNIEVTYKASIAADTPAEFATAVSDLRNWLCSKTGYVRLSDDYNPNEYRMAVYKSGLDVDPFAAMSGEFDIVFDCKPQRFLTSGETAVSVASGGKVTNPTLFPSHPMLQVWGYGDINVGNNTVSIINSVMGNIIVSNGITTETSSTTISIDDTYALSGDSLTFAGATRTGDVWDIGNGYTSRAISISGNGSADIVASTGTGLWGSIFDGATVNLGSYVFTYGTSYTNSVTATISFTTRDYGTQTAVVGVSLAYDGAHTFTLTHSRTFSAHVEQIGDRKWSITTKTITLNSSVSTLASPPIYIDLDIGEAYVIENGSAASVNNSVQIPPELPTLQSGATNITYDNTITQLKILPRWWKV